MSRAPKGFDAGKLNVRVQIQSRAVGTTEGGFALSEFSNLGGIRYVEWNDDGAREVGYRAAMGEALTGIQRARLIMRHVDGVDLTCRLIRVADDSLWSIVNIKEYFGGNAYMELVVEKMVEGGEA